MQDFFAESVYRFNFQHVRLVNITEKDFTRTRHITGICRPIFRNPIQQFAQRIIIGHRPCTQRRQNTIAHFAGPGIGVCQTQNPGIVVIICAKQNTQQTLDQNTGFSGAGIRLDPYVFRWVGGQILLR